MIGSDAAKLAIENPLLCQSSPKPRPFSPCTMDVGVPGVRQPVAEPGTEGRCMALDGMKERRMLKDESTMPVMTLLAESVIALTCWPTRLHRLAWRALAGSRGVSEVIGLWVSGIGVRSAILKEESEKKEELTQSLRDNGSRWVVQNEPHDFVTIP